MKESYELLQQINWFLEPVSNFILFLFTTKTGLIILLSILLLYLIFTTGNAIKVRKLIHRGGTSRVVVPFGEILYIIGSEITKLFAKILSNIPILLGIILFFTAIVGMSASFKTFDNFMANQQRIKELKTVVKHLDKRYKVAKLEILNIDEVNNKTTLKVHFFDYEKDIYIPETQEIIIDGQQIYFMAYVLNFDYSEIETGTKKNIVIPSKIFSEVVPSENGYMLNIKDTAGVPYIFHRAEKDVFGLTLETYNERIKEISSFITDKDKAREAGIRSFWGNFVHYDKKLRKGMKIIIWVEQTGGLVIKEKTEF